jgi:SAM-dependent methyltransferase
VGDSVEVDRVRSIYDRTAPDYDQGIGMAEKIFFGGGREWVCSQARCNVLDIARRRARKLGLAVTFQEGNAEAMPFPDSTFDTVVVTLALCTIPHPEKAVMEVRRVLKTGGRFLAMEHVGSPILPVRLIQMILDPLTVRFDGDHVLREPLEYVKAAGLDVEYLERRKLGVVEWLAARKSESSK